MKDLILDPLILIPSIGIAVVYFFILLRFSGAGQISHLIEKATISLFLLLLIKPIIPPLNYLQPDALAGSDKTFVSAVIQLAVYGFFIVLSKPLFRNFFESVRFLFKDPFLGGLLIVSTLSALWSDTPWVALKFGLVQLFVSLFAAQIARKNNLDVLEKYIRWMCLIAAILSLFTAIAAPSIGVGIEDTPPFSTRWRGIFPFPIKLGTGMALSITLWINHLMSSSQQRLISFGAIALSFFLLMQAVSAQAIFTLIVLLGFLVLLNFMQRFDPKQTVVVGVLLLVGFAVMYIGVTENLEAIFGSLGKDTTLTGRTEFWPQLLEAIGKRPILGYGVHGFWQPWRGAQDPAGHIIAARGFIPPNGHNGFLDLAVEVGYLGLALFFLSFVLTSIQAIILWKQSQLPEATFSLILLLYVIMANVSETQLFVTNYIWFSYVLMSVRLNMREDKISVTDSSKLLV